MKHDVIGRGELDYQLCSYGFSRLAFRGPKPDPDDDYVAFVGGTETFGRFIAQPFPALIQARTGMPCLNLGLANAGIGAHLSDSAVMAACHDARLTVVEVMGAHNLSNRFYKVHPRRNDRVVSVTPLLAEIFDEIDFVEMPFTRHLLATLIACCPRRFEIVRRELRRVWTSRMRSFLAEMPAPPILLWFAPHAPETAETEALGAEPLFVTREMLEGLGDLTAGLLEVCPDAATRDAGRHEMVFGPSEAQAADHMMGPGAHDMVAEAVAPEIERMLRVAA